MPRVLAPREWGARVDYDKWNDPFTPDDGVALHHGGGADYPAGRTPHNLANEIAQFRAWENYHLDTKKWRGIAYGFGVGQTGTILRGRGFNRYGAHTGDVDGDGIANNDEVVPIIWIASGNHHTMSSAAAASIQWLRLNVILPRSPNARYLYGHQELKGTVTSCPGPAGMAYVRANRVEDTMLTPAQKQAVDWLINALSSRSDNAPPWGGWFWERYKAIWRGSPPGPLGPVTHVQLGYVWEVLNDGIVASNKRTDALTTDVAELRALVEAGGPGADAVAREMLQKIHQATQ